MKPIFIMGNIAVTFEDGTRREFPQVRISLWGVSGLPLEFPNLSLISAATIFGKPVKIEVEAEHTQGRVFLVAPGWILREVSETAIAVGIRFDLTSDQRGFLQKYIARHGFTPTEYARAYPRIATDEVISTFPMQSVVLRRPAAEGERWPYPIALNVLNLSPGGILVSTENQATLSLRAGDRFAVLLEPRGWFPSTVALEGMICRVIDDRSLRSGNVIRQMGVKFVAMDQENQSSFRDLLSDILNQMRERLTRAA